MPTEVKVKLNDNPGLVACTGCEQLVSQREAVGLSFNGGPKTWYCEPCIRDGKMDGPFKAIGDSLQAFFKSSKEWTDA